jgi:hypothetical protein
VDNSTLTCITPPVGADSGTPSYVLVLDNTPFPSSLPAELELSIAPNPTLFMLLTESIQAGMGSRFIEIQVKIVWL